MMEVPTLLQLFIIQYLGNLSMYLNHQRKVSKTQMERRRKEQFQACHIGPIQLCPISPRIIFMLVWEWSRDSFHHIDSRKIRKEGSKGFHEGLDFQPIPVYLAQIRAASGSVGPSWLKTKRREKLLPKALPASCRMQAQFNSTTIFRQLGALK